MIKLIAMLFCMMAFLIAITEIIRGRYLYYKNEEAVDFNIGQFLPKIGCREDILDDDTITNLYSQSDRIKLESLLRMEDFESNGFQDQEQDYY